MSFAVTFTLCQGVCCLTAQENVIIHLHPVEISRWTFLACCACDSVKGRFEMLVLGAAGHVCSGCWSVAACNVPSPALLQHAHCSVWLSSFMLRPYGSLPSLKQWRALEAWRWYSCAKCQVSLTALVLCVTSSMVAVALMLRFWRDSREPKKLQQLTITITVENYTPKKRHHNSDITTATWVATCGLDTL